MLNDRDRHLLKDLERQLQQEEDPAWVRQFKDPKPPRRTQRDCFPRRSSGCWCF
jgi:hypothetical protein